MTTTTQDPSILLSGRSITTLQAHTMSGAQQVRSPGNADDKHLEIEGRLPPLTGDLRLMATLDAASRRPGLDGVRSRSCSGVVSASFFDGSAWHRFDLKSLIDTPGFQSASELDAALRWARTAASDAAGRICERRSVDKQAVRPYGLAGRARMTTRIRPAPGAQRSRPMPQHERIWHRNSAYIPAAIPPSSSGPSSDDGSSPRFTRHTDDEARQHPSFLLVTTIPFATAKGAFLTNIEWCSACRPNEAGGPATPRVRMLVEREPIGRTAAHDRARVLAQRYAVPVVLVVAPLPFSAPAATVA
ncbi:MAG TPA: hypothetical protein VEB22_06825 [Phycisphaerales bacterium]|nr:hypothetical protein [Phycisphaerales bacterium]